MRDRVMPLTRIVALLIVPFLVVACAVLYLRPDDTARLFAWRIDAHMTSFLLASAYFGGAYFFVRTALARCWHCVSVGFIPVTTFATLMLIATALDWNRFNHGTLPFTVWIILYAVTPVLVPAVWLLNRRADPRRADPADVVVPRAVRAVTFILGAVVVLTAIALFIAPAAVASVWPWPLTPLTARVCGAMFALTGVFGITIPLDPRWSSARIAFQSLAVAQVLILVGVVRAWDEFNSGNAVSWLFVIGMCALLAGVVILYVTLEPSAFPRAWPGRVQSGVRGLHR
jgi:hypothetical protein